MIQTTDRIRMRDTYLPFALPDLDGSELREIADALESGWVTSGPKTRQFETEFASVVGAKHAIAVNSCTAAMHLALDAIGLKRGEEVITTPYTFAATAEVIRYFDAKPVLVDVDRETLNINPALIERAMSPRTRAIIPVHIAGLPVDLDAVQAVAHPRGIPVIEDAAHAFPVAYKGRMIGSISDITCFSFYATKTITTGEGGMICTANDEWAERCRIMSLHGISKDAWKRYTAEGSWYYEIIAAGYKYNMTDVAAAMGLAQLRKARVMFDRRKDIARRYHEAFAPCGELQVPHEGPDGHHAWHLYMLRLNLDRLTINRAQFMEELKKRNIGASVHFIPLHVHPYYRDTFGFRPDDLPVAHSEFLREISLPIFSKMSDADVQSVIDAVLDIARAMRK
jgi:dTDP-4-amino-4,6-dideoxygalactose transaminase